MVPCSDLAELNLEGEYCYVRNTMLTPDPLASNSIHITNTDLHGLCIRILSSVTTPLTFIPDPVPYI